MDIYCWIWFCKFFYMYNTCFEKVKVLGRVLVTFSTINEFVTGGRWYIEVGGTGGVNVGSGKVPKLWLICGGCGVVAIVCGRGNEWMLGLGAIVFTVDVGWEMAKVFGCTIFALNSAGKLIRAWGCAFCGSWSGADFTSFFESLDCFLWFGICTQMLFSVCSRVTWVYWGNSYIFDDRICQSISLFSRGFYIVLIDNVLQFRHSDFHQLFFR